MGGIKMAQNSQEALIREEQEILDHLIEDMDAVLKELDGRLDDAKLRRQRAIDRCLPETYGDLIKAESDIQSSNNFLRYSFISAPDVLNHVSTTEMGVSPYSANILLITFEIASSLVTSSGN